MERTESLQNLAAQFKVLHPLRHFRNHIENNVRQDGRRLDDYRSIGINNGAFANCNGSSVVKLGKTNIICGIRAELSKPTVKSPHKGYIVPIIDTSLVSLTLKPEQTDILTCLLYDALHHSHCIDLKELCICSKKLAWVLYIEIFCLDHDGGLLDAMILASVAALRNLKLPLIDYNEKTGKVIVKAEMRELVVQMIPIPTTHSKFDDKLLLDPTLIEEDYSTCSLLLGVNQNDVMLLLKSGGAPVNKSNLESCISNASNRKNDVLKLINNLEI